MKIATAAYPMDFLNDWADYEAKVTRWVAAAAGQGAGLLVFPEYGAMELATLSGREIAMDLEASMRAVSDLVPEADALHLRLAAQFSVHILAASAPVYDDSVVGAHGARGLRPVNRARYFTPSGKVAVMDKQIMTRFERETWDVVGGAPLAILETEFGKVGVLICYDSEFPLLGRALAEVDILLVPSCTEALSGYWRVRIGTMARALENQCIAVMSSTVGQCDWSPAVDSNVGAGGVYGPPDAGFPNTGVLAVGDLNVPGWTFADVSLEAVKIARTQGTQFNRRHWDDQTARAATAPITAMR